MTTDVVKQIRRATRRRRPKLQHNPRDPRAVQSAAKLVSTTAAPIASPHTLTAVRKRSSSQSIERINPIYSTGRPTALRTMTIVTRPASGIPAAPIAARGPAQNRWPGR